MTPEVLQEKFLDWQCQSRIQAFRTENGRPNSSMMPFLLDKKGNELSKKQQKIIQAYVDLTNYVMEHRYMYEAWKTIVNVVIKKKQETIKYIV